MPPLDLMRLVCFFAMHTRTPSMHCAGHGSTYFIIYNIIIYIYTDGYHISQYFDIILWSKKGMQRAYRRSNDEIRCNTCIYATTNPLLLHSLLSKSFYNSTLLPIPPQRPTSFLIPHSLLYSWTFGKKKRLRYGK